MGEAEDNRGKERLCMQIHGSRRDLSKRFVVGNHSPEKFEESGYDNEEERDVELSLGLSLNGRFGVDPLRAKKLKRSSSISNLVVSTDDCSGGGAEACAPLTRTCSLPAATEEEWRKRKELQTLRRFEAKRKRMEKLKNVRMVRDRGDLDDNSQENGQGFVGTDGNGFPPARPSSQGSFGSQGSGSSGISDFDNQPMQGLNRDPPTRSPGRVQSLPVEIEPKPLTTSGKSENISAPMLGNPSRNLLVAGREGKMSRNVMIDMPCVSTKGDGPHGKRIEGFLYRYRKGEEVKIVCVCHGSFHSPAEFVKHAGGGDVTHPLRHIVVNPSPLL